MRPLLLCHSPNFHFYAQENIVRLKRIQIGDSVIMDVVIPIFSCLLFVDAMNSDCDTLTEVCESVIPG